MDSPSGVTEKEAVHGESTYGDRVFLRLMNYEAGKMVGSSLQILRLLDTSQQLETKDNVSEYVADKAREQKGPKELVLKVHKSQEC